MDNTAKDTEKPKRKKSVREILRDISNLDKNLIASVIERNLPAAAVTNPIPELEGPANYDQGFALRNQNPIPELEVPVNYNQGVALRNQVQYQQNTLPELQVPANYDQGFALWNQNPIPELEVPADYNQRVALRNQVQFLQNPIPELEVPANYDQGFALRNQNLIPELQVSANYNQGVGLRNQVEYLQNPIPELQGPSNYNQGVALRNQVEYLQNTIPELQVPANYDQGVALWNQNPVPELEVSANYNQGVALRNQVQYLQNPIPENQGVALRNQNVGGDWTPKPNPVIVDLVSSESGEKIDLVPKKKCRREDQIPNSPPATKRKKARGILIEPEGHAVDRDADDFINNLAADEYLDELYNFYKLTENEDRASNYMQSQKEINMNMRTIVVDWLVEAHRHFNLKTETLFLTVSILDRYLSLINIPKIDLQLVGVCSMSLAAKFEEVTYPEVNQWLGISANAYNRHQFIAMETDIVEKIQWNLTVPTPYVFLVRLIGASLMPDKELENMAYYLAELALVNYNVMVSFPPSKIAAAAFYSACCMLNRIQYWTPYLRKLSGYSKEDIKLCATVIVSIHESAATDVKMNSVYRKFSSPRKGYIARLPQPYNIQQIL